MRMETRPAWAIRRRAVCPLKAEAPPPRQRRAGPNPEDTPAMMPFSAMTRKGRSPNFKSLKWCRNVLDVMAAARGRFSKGPSRPTFLVAAVAADMACYAKADGSLFRAESDQQKAVGASASNIREARHWLCRVGLAEVVKIDRPDDTKRGQGQRRDRFRPADGRCPSGDFAPAYRL